MASWTAASDNTWGGGGGDGGENSWGGDAASATVEDGGNVSDPDEAQPEPQEEKKKPARIRQKDIEQLQTDRSDGKEKHIAIFKRPDKGAALVEFYPKFSRAAAAVFCGAWAKMLEHGGAALIIDATKFKGSDLEPLMRILDWINLCVDEGNDVKFPEITDTKDALNLVIEIIKTANKLEVPEMSLQVPLSKAAMKYTRQSLISYENVEAIYDGGAPEHLGALEHLREAAAASIFNAWWHHVLDDPAYDVYCSNVEQMRAKFPELDDDLNKRFDDKKEYINRKNEERRQARANGGRGGGFRGGPRGNNGNPHANTAADYPEDTGPDGGWSVAAAAVGDEPAAEDPMGGEWAAEPAQVHAW